MDGGDTIYGRREMEKGGDGRLLFLCLATIRLGLIAVWLGSISTVAPASAAEESKLTPLAIESARGNHTFQVEVAATKAERARGLMERTSLAPDRGMLFDYGTETHVAMWMKNTFVSLDMIFVANNGRIISTRENTEPLSLETIKPDGGEARAVVEVLGGTVARTGIAAGDQVRHRIFGDNLKLQ